MKEQVSRGNQFESNANVKSKSIDQIVNEYEETNLKEVTITITNEKLNEATLYGSTSKHGRTIDKFNVPTYKMTVSGLNGGSHPMEFEVIRFGVHQFSNDAGRVVGLSSADSVYSKEWLSDYNPGIDGGNDQDNNGAWLIKGTHKIQDGIDDLTSGIADATGHIEVCGKGEFSKLNRLIRRLSGVQTTGNDFADSNQLITSNGKLKIVIEEADIPNLVPLSNAENTMSKKELEQFARSKLAQNSASFKEMDQLEKHGREVFNTYHKIRLLDFICENADKEGSVAVGETEEAFKKCSPTVYFGLNKLYNWKNEKKIISGYIEDRLNEDGTVRDVGINTLMEGKGLTDGEKRFWAMTKNGAMGNKVNNDKIDRWPQKIGPTNWALDQCKENGVHIFTVSVMGGYHSMMLIIDKRVDGVPEIYIKDQHNKRPALNRKIPHTVEEIDVFFMKMIKEWNGPTTPDNKTIRLLKIKRDI